MVEERVTGRIDQTGKKPRKMTAIDVLNEVGFRSPTNTQCKECGALLRKLYGPPKRINGRDKWPVCLLPPEDIYRLDEYDDPDNFV